MQKYVGKVEINFPNMYLICGVDFIKDCCIVRSITDSSYCYGAVLPDKRAKVYTLSEAHQILSENMKYLVEWNDFLIRYCKAELMEKEDMKILMRRIWATLLQIDVLTKSHYKNKTEQLRQLRKGLYRIKKRTHHYFSDELFSFIEDNYLKGYKINFFGIEMLENAQEYYSTKLNLIEKMLL